MITKNKNKSNFPSQSQKTTEKKHKKTQQNPKPYKKLVQNRGFVRYTSQLYTMDKNTHQQKQKMVNSEIMAYLSQKPREKTISKTQKNKKQERKREKKEKRKTPKKHVPE